MNLYKFHDTLESISVDLVAKVNTMRGPCFALFTVKWGTHVSLCTRTDKPGVSYCFVRDITLQLDDSVFMCSHIPKTFHRTKHIIDGNKYNDKQ